MFLIIAEIVFCRVFNLARHAPYAFGTRYTISAHRIRASDVTFRYKPYNPLRKDPNAPYALRKSQGRSVTPTSHYGEALRRIDPYVIQNTDTSPYIPNKYDRANYAGLFLVSHLILHMRFFAKWRLGYFLE